jgi:thioredoxin
MRRTCLLEVTLLTAFVVAGCGQHDMANIAPPTDSWFQERVVKQDLPVLVDFGATWCPPCKELEPHLDKLKEQYADKLKVVKVDVDERGEVASHYGVQGIPAMMIFKDGHVVADEVGYMSYQDLEEWVTKHVP